MQSPVVYDMNDSYLSVKIFRIFVITSWLGTNNTKLVLSYKFTVRYTNNFFHRWKKPLKGTKQAARLSGSVTFLATKNPSFSTSDVPNRFRITSAWDLHAQLNVLPFMTGSLSSGRTSTLRLSYAAVYFPVVFKLKHQTNNAIMTENSDP